MSLLEIIADKLSASGSSWGCSSQTDATGPVLFTADAHRDNGKKRFGCPRNLRFNKFFRFPQK
jgi:hypothetical protein